MEIKRLTDDDFYDAANLIYETAYTNKYSDNKKIFYDLFKDSYKSMELFGYYVLEKLVGVVGIEDMNYISILYVLKEYQKCSIGTKLLNYIKEYVKAETEILDVCSVKTAISFYEQNDFERYIKDDNSSTIMMYYKVKEKKNENKNNNFIW